MSVSASIALIDQNITTNNNQEITGEVLNQTLKTMLSSSISASYAATASYVNTGYKEYIARIDQSGTNNPVLQVQKNTTGATITALRGNQGYYEISSSLPIFVNDGTKLNFRIDNPTYFLIFPSPSGSGAISGMYRDSDNILAIQTLDLASSTFQDSLLSESFIYIQIFD